MRISRSRCIIVGAAMTVLAANLHAAATSFDSDAWYYDKYFQRQETFGLVTDEIIIKYQPQITADAATGVADRHGLNQLHGLQPNFHFAHYRLPAGQPVWDAASALEGEQFVRSAYPVLIDQRGDHKPVVGDEMTVQFAAGMSEEACLAVIKEMGSKVLRDQWTPGYYTIAVPEGHTLFSGIRAFNARQDVKFAEFSLIGFDDELFVPNDPYFDDQWNLDNTGQISSCSWCTPYEDHDADAVLAWDLTMGIPSVIIVIIDTGCDLDHPDLAANFLPRGNEDWDFADDFDDVPEDTYGHGTACAGIAAAVTNNGTGVAGMAPGCQIMPLRINLSSGMNQNRADAINYAASRRAEFDGMVLSNSWRMSSGSYTAVYNAIENAKTSGCVICFASGNGNSSSLDAPSDSEYCIAIGGTSPCDERKSTSSCDGENYWGANYGTGLDVCAPCVKITTTELYGGYQSSFNGTSSATPLAAGVCGLILSANTSLSPDEVQDALEAGCDDLESAGWDQYTGWGRINAYNSILLVMNDCPEDVNADDVVDIDDIFAVLAEWGPCTACPEDVNEDGNVDIDDIFAVLAAWGPC